MRVHRLVVSTILALAMLVGPLAAEAQQAGKVWRIGTLDFFPRPDPGSNAIWDAFLQRLRELGYVEGQNIAIEWRHVEGGRFADAAAELVRLNVDVILVPSTRPALAAKQATTTIPIVMAAVGDPVEAGLVRSLGRPGGNITGLSVIGFELSSKRVELLKEALPKVSRVAVLVDPTNPAHAIFWRGTEIAAQALRLKLQRLDVRGPNDFEGAFATMTKERAEALIVLPEPMTYYERRRLADLAARSRLPAMHGLRGHAEAGDLMAYAPDYRDLYRRAAGFVDKVLKGAKPADLPVEQPMTFELVINLKTAKALGLTIPRSVLLRADEIIE